MVNFTITVLIDAIADFVSTRIDVRVEIVTVGAVFDIAVFWISTEPD
jgi:hypothetical protein